MLCFVARKGMCLILSDGSRLNVRRVVPEMLYLGAVDVDASRVKDGTKAGDVLYRLARRCAKRTDKLTAAPFEYETSHDKRTISEWKRSSSELKQSISRHSAKDPKLQRGQRGMT